MRYACMHLCRLAAFGVDLGFLPWIQCHLIRLGMQRTKSKALLKHLQPKHVNWVTIPTSKYS